MLEGWHRDKRFDPTLAFLPAPTTWIECILPMAGQDGDIQVANVLFTDES